MSWLNSLNLPHFKVPKEINIFLWNNPLTHLCSIKSCLFLMQHFFFHFNELNHQKCQNLIKLHSSISIIMNLSVLWQIIIVDGIIMYIWCKQASMSESWNKISRNKLMSKGSGGYDDEWSCEKLFAALIVTCAVLLVLNYCCGLSTVS